MQELNQIQPIGAFAFPAGLLLLEAEELDSEAARALVRGRVPSPWPASLRGHELTHQGDLDAAAAHFAKGASPIQRYNHFLLAPDGIDAMQIRDALPPELALMVDAVRYCIGEIDTPPAEQATDPVIDAVLDSMRATAAIAAGDPTEAAAILRNAAEALADTVPVLAAVLLGNAGSILSEHNLDQDAALEDLRVACLGLAETDLAQTRAEFHLQVGLALHERAAHGRVPLKDAVHEYFTALQLVDKESSPYTWAAANMNLGSAYLTMPMVEATDQLRSGIAMQALRSSLEVFTRERHPAEWASAQLNLANALVYTPSAHQGDNIVEAVERYEEVLATRDRMTDPLGRARILANLGNALAHLGIFDHAKSRLYEARYLFEEHLDHDSAMMVRSILDEVSRETVPDSGRVGHALPARPPLAAEDVEEVGS